MGQKSHQQAPEQRLKCHRAAGAVKRDKQLPNLLGSDKLVPQCLGPLTDDRTGSHWPSWQE